MSELNGGVVLGGRELRLTIPRGHAQDLQTLAMVFGTTSHKLAEDMLVRAIEMSATQVMVGQVVVGYLTSGRMVG